MQNKWNSAFQGFIPVSGNWDFAATGENCGNRNNRRRGCRAGQTTAASCPQATENSQTPCQPEYSECQAACQAGCTAAATCTRTASCTCEACTAARQTACEYQTCPVTCNECQTARTSCNSCSVPCAQTAATAGRNQGVGIVRGQEQQLGQLYQTGAALRAGTLFPELHKPMNGYCPPISIYGTREQALAFTAWELRLYLDTHPDDAQALALLHQLENQLADPNYATTFLPEGSNWTWTDDPWPWNYSCRCGD